MTIDQAVVVFGYLFVFFALLLLVCIGVVVLIEQVRKAREARKTDPQVREFSDWIEAVDRTVGIAELLKGRK